ncbi:MAG: carbohydrate binding domain-containing protein [Clostridia bacterium]|nr:carbohydrate binding domain-containing protein [Clostridia bacterium]
MKMKRLMSWLLVSSLMCSSFPLGISAEGEAVYDTESQGSLTEDGKAYVNQKGDSAVKVDEGVAFSSYLHATDAANNNKTVFGFGYRSTALTSAIESGDGGEFELSFYARSATAALDNIVLTLGSEYSSEFILTKVGSSGDAGLGYTVVSAVEGGETSGNKLALSTEWQKYTITFTLDGSVRNIASRGIRFHMMKNPIDIANLSLKRIDAGNEALIVGDGIAGEWYTDKLYINSANLETLPYVSEYYSVEAVSGENTVIGIDSDEILPMGIYSISTELCANTPVKLTASAGEEYSEAVDVTTSWAKTKLTLKLTKDTKYSDIKFTFDGSCTVDFTDITFEKTVDFTSDYQYLDDSPVSLVNEKLTFTTYLNAVSNDDNSNSAVFGFGYRSNTLTNAITNGDGGTYELSFYAKSATAALDNIVLTLGSEFSSEFILTKVGTSGDSGIGSVSVSSIEGGTVSGGKLALSSEWQKYIITFTIDGGVRNIADRGVRFHLMKNPIDVAALSLKRIDAGNEAVIIGDGIDGEWYTDKVYIDSARFETRPVINEYYRAEAIDGEDTVIKPGSDATLPIGVYELTGKFRSSSDAKLTVSVGNVACSAVDINTVWSNQKLMVQIKKEVPISDIKFALDGSFCFDFVDITLTKVQDYSADYRHLNDEPTVKISEKAEFTGYIHAIDNADNGKASYGFGYRSDALTNAVTTGKGTYELTMWLRFNPEAGYEGELNNVTVTLGSEYSSEYILSAVGGDDSVKVTSIDGDTAFNQYGSQFLAPSTEWQKYTIKFELDGDVRDIAGKGIRFHGLKIPFEVGGLSLTRTDTSEVIIDDKDVDIDNWYTDKVYINSASLEVKPFIADYYRAESISGANTAVKSGLDDVLSMGIYEISGNFRAGTAANLTASANGETSEPVALTSDWSVSTLTVRLKSATKLSDIIIALDAPYTLEFTDLAIKKLADYDITEWTTADGGPVVSVSESVEFSSYLYVVDSTNNGKNSYGFGYRSNALTDAITNDDGDTYKLSFSIRSATEELDNIILTLGTEFSSEFILSKLGATGDDTIGHINVLSIEGGAEEKGKLLLSNEWQNYTITFTVDGGVRNIANRGIRFHALKNPIEIGGLSLTVCDTNEVIIDDSEVSLTNWYTDKLYINSASFERRVCIPEYYRAEGVPGVNTAVKSASGDTLEAGIYHVSGDFRINGSNDDAAALFASINGAQLMTINDSESKTLSNVWKNVTFVIDTKVDGLNVSDLMFMLDGDMDLEFANVTINQTEYYVELYDINIGTIMTLLMIKKAYNEGRPPIRDYGGVRVELPLNEMPVAPTEGNLVTVSQVIRKSNWSYGDQSLSFRYDDDGAVIGSARDIVDNRVGFTYSPNVALRSGVYTFSGEFRAANEGETTVLRVYVGGQLLLFTVTNEWKKVEVTFELDEKTPLEFTVKGGPVAWYTQDYDMRNLTVTDQAANPYDLELDTDGDFEGESSLNNWKPQSGAGVIDRVTEDGNTFMRSTKRTKNFTSLYYTLPEGVIAGVAYRVTFDIRTSNPGETTIARAHYYEGDSNELVDMAFSVGASDSHPQHIDVDNEWKHVETVFVATVTGDFRFGICGGPYAEYIQDFDIDNFKIIRLNYGLHLGEYNDGDFEDPLMATAKWTPASGAGKILHVVEDGNGFLRNTERTRNYQSIILTTGITLEKGQSIRIAYDVRTSNPGETSVHRINVRVADSGIIDVPVRAESTTQNGYQYEITNEWTHVEATYTSGYDGMLKFGICGGPYAEDIQDFDIDNLIVEVVH